jgi:hypothetical protein
MEKPGYKSLLDIDRLLEAWRSPGTAAPQRMTLLKHVADLAAALDPADREGGENAIPVVVKGPERKPQAMPMTWAGQKDEGAPIPPRLDVGPHEGYGAGKVAPSADRPKQGPAVPQPLVSLAPLMASGGQDGRALPDDSVRVANGSQADGLDENVLRGLLAKHKPTNDDLNTLVSVADDLKRQKKTAPDAFAKQPEIAREFSRRFDVLKGVTRDTLLRKLGGREPTPEELDEADEKAARIAHFYANHKMTMSAAIKTAGEKGSGWERDQEFGMAGVDPAIFGPGKWQSQDDLKKALAAAGPGAFVVADRPLPLNLYRDPQAGSRADVENREVHHKHVFYLDADGTLRDAGFFDDGIRKGQEGRDKGKKLQAGESDELDNLGRYHFGDIQNGGNLRPEMFDLKGFDASNYRLLTHNCQTYVEAVQRMVRQAQGAAPRS